MFMPTKRSVEEEALDSITQLPTLLANIEISLRVIGRSLETLARAADKLAQTIDAEKVIEG
jgi:hypothetical protein